MPVRNSIPTPHSVPEYVSDGARIAAILLIWGILAASVSYVTSSLGMFGTVGWRLGDLLAVAGVLNAVLYIVYRAIDYYRIE